MKLGMERLGEKNSKEFYLIVLPVSSTRAYLQTNSFFNILKVFMIYHLVTVILSFKSETKRSVDDGTAVSSTC